MKVKVEIDCDQENQIVTESLMWMYLHADLTKKEKKAYRTIIKQYMTHDQYMYTFKDTSCYE